jgi:hypothetical protein
LRCCGIAPCSASWTRQNVKLGETCHDIPSLPGCRTLWESEVRLRLTPRSGALDKAARRQRLALRHRTEQDEGARGGRQDEQFMSRHAQGPLDKTPNATCWPVADPTWLSDQLGRSSRRRRDPSLKLCGTERGEQVLTWRAQSGRIDRRTIGGVWRCGVHDTKGPEPTTAAWTKSTRATATCREVVGLGGAQPSGGGCSRTALTVQVSWWWQRPVGAGPGRGVTWRRGVYLESAGGEGRYVPQGPSLPTRGCQLTDSPVRPSAAQPVAGSCNRLRRDPDIPSNMAVPEKVAVRLVRATGSQQDQGR